MLSSVTIFIKILKFFLKMPIYIICGNKTRYGREKIMDIDVKKYLMCDLYKITDKRENSKGENGNSEEMKVSFSRPEISSYDEISDIELFGTMKILAMQNQFNFVSKNSNKFGRFRKGVSKFRFDDQNVTVYKNDQNVHVQVIGRKRADFNDIYRRMDEFEPIEHNVTANNGINGKIDEFIQQGGSGDCWLISGVLALNSTEEGRQIIEDAIISNSDGSVTVNFKGLGLSYNVSPSEIKEFDTDKDGSDLFSNGDNDMLAIEIAVAKLKKDISKGRVQLDVSEDSYEGSREASLEGGFAQQLIYFLTGKVSDTHTVEFSETQTDEEIQDALAVGLGMKEVFDTLNDAAKNMPSALTFGLYYEVKKAQCVDGTWFNFDTTSGGHAFAITDVNAENKTVTFVNPWDSTEEFTMSWDKFAAMGIGMLTSAKLDKIEQPKEEPSKNINVPEVPDTEPENDVEEAVVTPNADVVEPVVTPDTDEVEPVVMPDDNSNADDNVTPVTPDVNPKPVDNNTPEFPTPVNPDNYVNVPGLENWSKYIDFSVIKGLDEPISSDFSNIYDAVEQLRTQLFGYMKTKYDEMGFFASPISINRSINRVVFAELFIALNKPNETVKGVISNIMQTLDATIYGMSVFFSFYNMFGYGSYMNYMNF